MGRASPEQRTLSVEAHQQSSARCCYRRIQRQTDSQLSAITISVPYSRIIPVPRQESSPLHKKIDDLEGGFRRPLFKNRGPKISWLRHGNWTAKRVRAIFGSTGVARAVRYRYAVFVRKTSLCGKAGASVLEDLQLSRNQCGATSPEIGILESLSYISNNAGSCQTLSVFRSRILRALGNATNNAADWSLLYSYRTLGEMLTSTSPPAIQQRIQLLARLAILIFQGSSRIVPRRFLPYALF